MAIKKICSRCGRVVPVGRPCPCAAAAGRDRHNAYNSQQRDKKTQAFYNSRQWRSLSKRVLAIDGCDVYLYMTKGVLEPADTVHHVIPLADDWSKRLTVSNLMSLTHGTHSAIERLYKQNKETMISQLQQMLEAYRNEIGYDPYDI
jgi:5-methylcytosine-specific restriction endonuclease McrA